MGQRGLAGYLRGLCCLLGCLHTAEAMAGWPCGDGSDICAESACCVGSPSSGYSCRCGPGFILVPPNSSLHACRDGDKCATTLGSCGPNTTCTFSCICPPGYRGPNCTERFFACEPQILQDDAFRSCWRHSDLGGSPGDFCSMLNTTAQRLRAACSAGDRSGDIKLQETLAPLFNTTAQLQSEGHPKAVAVAELLLQTSEVLVLEAALRSRHLQPQYFTTENLSTILELTAGNDSMRIGCRMVLTNTEEGTGAVAFITYSNLEAVLDGSSVEEGMPPGRLNSRVVSGTVGKHMSFSEAFSFTLQHKTEQREDEEAYCVSWKLAGAHSHWSEEGCKRLEGSRFHTTCSCKHLSSFAILMAVGDVKESFALRVVTYVGLSLSVLCLFLAILTFLLCRSLWNVSVALHLQLSICLFVADILFLVAMHRIRNWLACAIVAGFLHYLFLACFTWMFLEGLHLFLNIRNLHVVNYTSASRFKKRYMYPVGYGVPALVVVISIAINPSGYRTDKHCWLSTEGGFVWSFIGPVCAIILVNLVFFLTTLWILWDKLSTLNKDVSSLKNTRVLTFKALAHVLILGCTWGLGLLQTHSSMPLVAFLFTGLNSLQGVFIFVVHCLLNKQVTGQYQRWLRALSPKADTMELNTMSSLNITSDTEGEKPTTRGNKGCEWQK
ncbi:adhesion G protein-coupled receptor E3 isoform X1 [Struthio camelus]|uniref:adhesion G protein-coupled receptor E3 isoform X1 n=1 Tax=Struthio camelus TaxID=8801 RepID=UPI0036041ABB